MVVNDTDGAQTLQQLLAQVSHLADPARAGKTRKTRFTLAGVCTVFRRLPRMAKSGRAFADYSRLYVDLPGHGGSAAISVDGFDDVTDLLRKTAVSYNILDFWLVVLAWRTGGDDGGLPGLAGLCGVIVEGGHPGLQNAEQRAERQRSDRQWAQRFYTEPLTAVFADWYQQPVFASLNDDQRRELVVLRSNNNGATLAAMLEATFSPSSLIYVLTSARTFAFYYLCGERDRQIPRPGGGTGCRLPCHSSRRT